jgi:predicted MPP superfamily phosphohydrolase
MRILHISDFHFIDSDHSKKRQSKIVSKLSEVLKINQNIDLIFFTGDLVYKGNSVKDFLLAAEQLFGPIHQTLDLNALNTFLCPGNHDVNRDAVFISNLTYIYDKITNNDLLNEFVKDSKNKDFDLSCKGTENYQLFYKEFIKDGLKLYSDKIGSLYSSHIRNVGGKKIGILSLNSSWISYSNEDRGKLLFPEIIINEALNKIKDCDYKFVLMHYPLESLNYFNRTVIEDTIFNNCDFLFFGDIHRRKTGVYYNFSGGIVEFVSPATLTKKGDGQIGFSIIDFDLNTEEIELNVHLYNNEEEIFYSLPKIKFDFPGDEKRTRNNKLRKSIRDLYSTELEKANEFFLLRYDIATDKNFLELFNAPNLKDKDELELILNTSLAGNVEINNLLSPPGNYIIYGKEKSGKSAILKKIQLDLISKFHDIKVIPFYVDCKRHKGNNSYDLESEIKKYFSHFSTSDIKAILNEFSKIILIDDLDNSSKIFRENLEKFLTEFDNTHIIATSSLTMFRRFKSVLFKGDRYKKLFIHSLGKSQVRIFSKKWLEKDDELIEEVVTNLTNSFRQFNLPFNYWTLSIFLWIYKKTKNFTFQNNAELIENYIDKLLDKDGLALAEDRIFTFNNFKTFLSELAYYFFKYHDQEGYCATYEQIFHFTEDFLKKNPRYIATPKYVLDYIFEKRILIEIENNTITFRLNSDLEYFLAWYISNNEEFRTKILNDEKLYLSFKNELDLHSGINRSDEIFLKKIYEKTKTVFEELNSRYKSSGSHDENLNSRIKQSISFSERINEILKARPLDYSKQDEIVDNVIPFNNHNDSYEVKTKNIQNNTIINFKLLEQHIFILARVFRNTDEIRDKNLVNEVFGFILDSYINLGFLLIEEVGDIDKIEEIMSENPERKEEVTFIKNLIQLTLNLVPLLMQVSLYESVGHINFENIIMERLEKLKLDYKKNQYVIFLLTYLLVDINIKNNASYLTELSELIDINSLTNSSIVKLTFYYVFKAHNKPNFEQFLKEQIKLQNVKLNPELGSREKMLELDQKISEKKKLSLIIQQRDN